MVTSASIYNNILQEIVYNGKITPEFVSDVTTNFLTNNKTIKWFTISFLKNDKRVFSIEHYGTEIILFDIPEDEKDIVSKYEENFAEVLRVDLFPGRTYA